MDVLAFLKENSTVILIVVGIIILLGVIYIRNRMMSTASESFKDSEMVCDDVTGICQRMPKNGGVSEANMEAAQKKMEAEIMEESQEAQDYEESQEAQESAN